MPTFQQFKYKECLPKRSLSALPSYLLVKPTAYDEVLLLRLLTGTVDFQNTISGIKFTQRINYSKFDFVTNRLVSAKSVTDIFKEESIKLTSAEQYYKNCVRFGNRNLFKNLLLELTNYFYQKEIKSDALAFLHLYRSIELVSYCFPLYFASKATSYEKTYSSLKDFFTKVDGELNFFKKFVHEHLFNNDPTILDTHLKISVNGPNSSLQEQYFKALKKLCDDNKNIDFISSSPFTEIVVTRKGLNSLSYDLRNRYFHLLTGDFNHNFSSGEISEVNYFYRNVNDIILNWLAQIYFKILLTKIDET